MIGQIRLAQFAGGIPKGETAEKVETGYPIRFPFGPSERSGKPTEVSRRLFAYFLVGEKVWLC
jgi:hypothetical protein